MVGLLASVSQTLLHCSRLIRDFPPVGFRYRALSNKLFRALSRETRAREAKPNTQSQGKKRQRKRTRVYEQVTYTLANMVELYERKSTYAGRSSF